MKAIVQNHYGSPDLLELQDIQKPSIKDTEVLVRVHAAGIHAGDYFLVRGVPFPARLVAGFPRPRGFVPGWSLAGRVEAIGAKVSRLMPGAEVFGETGHAFAEYAVGTEENLVAKPVTLDFVHAAAMPTSGLAALQGLRDHGKVQPGMKVLINGAAGGVGTFAVQLAKVLGAEVTGVCSAESADLVRSLGADHVVDHTIQDATTGSCRYDLVFDNVGNHSFSAWSRVLAPRGILLPNTGHAGMGYILGAYLRSIINSRQGRPFVSSPCRDDLLVLKQYAEEGRLSPVVAETYALAEAPEALRRVGEGHVHGKLVLKIADDRHSRDAADALAHEGGPK
jgi:NADPH:quinone reductase-like Zn-dependent oxidoreductase